LRLTDKVHLALSETLNEGDIAIDATAGNGHDTLFLAQHVGLSGHVYAFDIQQQALLSSQKLLSEHNCNTPVTWLCTGHEHLLKHVMPNHHGHIQAITFNLGYLPNSDKSKTTQDESTLTALDAGISILAVGGIISILAYTGHEGGRKEAEAVKIWAKNLHSCYDVSIYIPENTRTPPPEWIYIKKSC